jgi:hypothetical protein
LMPLSRRMILRMRRTLIARRILLLLPTFCTEVSPLLFMHSCGEQPCLA